MTVITSWQVSLLLFVFPQIILRVTIFETWVRLCQSFAQNPVIVLHFSLTKKQSLQWPSVSTCSKHLISPSSLLPSPHYTPPLWPSLVIIYILLESENVIHSVVSNSASPWTVALKASLSMRFSMQEYWSGLPFSLPADLLNPEMELTSPVLADRFFTSEPPFFLQLRKKKFTFAAISKYQLFPMPLLFGVACHTTAGTVATMANSKWSSSNQEVGGTCPCAFSIEKTQ